MLWTATVIENSRRVRSGGLSAWRVRSQVAPSTNIVSFEVADTLYTIHVHPVGRFVPAPVKTPAPAQEPRSWAEAAKQA
eukprot:4496028-Amphidinium_carterae.1